MTFWDFMHEHWWVGFWLCIWTMFFGMNLLRITIWAFVTLIHGHKPVAPTYQILGKKDEEKK